MMNTPTEHRRREDETVRERADQAPSYVEAKQMKSLRLHPHGCLRTLRTASANNLSGRMLFNVILSGMLILILVLVLKDSLMTFSSPCPCPGPWGSGPCPCPGPWGSGPCPCPGPWGSGPCPYPGPCGLVLVLVLVFSPYKDLFPLFHYSDLFA